MMSIEAVKAKYEARLMELPNVTGVGIGENAGVPVIKALVTRKVPKSALRPEEVVPETLEGFETDVEEVGVVTAYAAIAVELLDPARLRPSIKQVSNR